MFYINFLLLQVIIAEGDRQDKLIELIEQDLLPQLKEFTQPHSRVLSELNLQNVKWKPLQIQFQFLDNPEIENEKIQLIQQVLEVAGIFFGKHIMVRDQGEVITFGNKTTCAGFEILEIYRLTNYTADLVIFVQLQNDNQTNQFAYSGPCKITSYDLRPIFGIIVWNTNLIDTAEITPSQFQYTTLTAIHEIIHTLGFIRVLYPYYYDSTTFLNYNLSLQNDTNNHLIIETPRLQNLSKTYFQCDEAQGAIMENEGGVYAAENHFERTIYFNELMTASKLNGELLLSDFTFQFIQDMGYFNKYTNSFYRLLEYQPDKMNWGKGKGCDFLFLSCDILQKSEAYDEFCNENGYHCSYDHNGIGQCGYDQFSDQCKYHNIQKGLDCKNMVTNQSNNLKDWLLQTHAIQSSDSICFDVVATNQQTFTTNLEQSCFQYECKNDEVYIQITQNNQTLLYCPNEDLITVSDQNFNIKCPKDQQKICQSKNNCENYCNKRGYCMNQQCTCIKGFAGKNCELDCLGYRNGIDCVDQCNQNQYQDNNTLFCLNCSGVLFCSLFQNCKSCTSISNCMICDQGYQLVQGFCDPLYEKHQDNHEKKVQSSLLLTIIIYFIQ